MHIGNSHIVSARHMLSLDRKWVRIVGVAVLMISVVLYIFIKSVPVLGKVKVSDRDELREALSASGEKSIELTSDITLRDTMYVRGRKLIDGHGHIIRRAVSANSGFGGDIICVKSGVLSIKNVIINGRGDAKVLKGKIYGRLIDVKGGQLQIGVGAVLKNNINITKAADGGGAIRIRKSGEVVMASGGISGNRCITGGGAIRVDKGASFYMKGGYIRDNHTVGKASVTGFEGRAGAIKSAGTLILAGGVISSNTVSGYISHGRHYGGIGGAIVSSGTCVIKGTRISNNKASVSGGGIYTVSGSELYISGGVVSGNIAPSGKDITYHAGGLKISSGINIGTVEVGKGCHINAQNLKLSAKIRLIPEKYLDGTYLVKGKKGVLKKCFSLGESAGFTLKVSGGGLMLRKKVKSAPSTVTDKGKKKESKKKTPVKKTVPKSVKKSSGLKNKTVTATPVPVWTLPPDIVKPDISDTDTKHFIVPDMTVPYTRAPESVVTKQTPSSPVPTTPASPSSSPTRPSPTQSVYTYSVPTPAPTIVSMDYEVVDDEVFLSSDMIVVWHFAPGDIKRASKFIDGLEHPFYKDAGWSFLSEFKNCMSIEKAR